MIERIIHFGDIHIRYGDEETSRYTEYLDVIDELDKVLDEEVDDKTVIVITGDLLHYKTKVDKYGIKIFNKLMNIVTKHSHVIVIGGNHDMGDDDIDILEALIELQGNDKVLYWKKTGNYKYKNIVFGVKSFKDEDLMIPENFKKPYDYKVMLYHGQINKAKMQNNQEIKSKISIDLFNMYDFILLGDIHLRQYKDNWGYCGSLIQQNYGEDVIEHGILIWDLKNGKVRERNIFNRVGYINILNEEDELYKVLNKKKECKLTEFSKKQNMPSILNAIVTTDDINEDKIRTNISKILDNVNIIKIIYDNDDVIYNRSETEDDVDMDLDKYMINSLGEDDGKYWIRMQENIGLFKFKEEDYPEDLVKFVNDENKNINVIDIKKVKNDEVRTKINLIDMEWKWVLCFKDNNYFNFETLDKRIILIGGKNGSGKTSFFEVICLGLFGEQIPTRKGLNNSVINLGYPKENGMISIRFKKSDIEYKIVRTFKIRKAENLLSEAELCKIEDGRELKMFSKVKEVNGWVEEHIGTINTFLLNTMITQNLDNDFFEQKDDMQMNMIGKVMNFDEIPKIERGMKKMIDIYRQMLKQLNIYNEIINERLKDKDMIINFEDKTDVIKENIKSINKRINELVISLKSFEKKELEMSNDEIDEELNKFKKQLKTIICNYEWDDVQQMRGIVINELDKLKEFNEDITMEKDELYKRIEKLKDVINVKKDKTRYDISAYNKWKKNNDKIENEINTICGSYDRFIKVINGDVNKPTISGEDIKRIKSEIQNIKRHIKNTEWYDLDDDEFMKLYLNKMKDIDKSIKEGQNNDNLIRTLDKKIKKTEEKLIKLKTNKPIKPKITMEGYNRWEERYTEMEGYIIEMIDNLEEMEKNNCMYDNKVIEKRLINDRIKEIDEEINNFDNRYTFNDECKCCKQNKKVLLDKFNNEVNRLSRYINDIDKVKEVSKEEIDRIKDIVNEWNKMNSEIKEYEQAYADIDAYVIYKKNKDRLRGELDGYKKEQEKYKRQNTIDLIEINRVKDSLEYCKNTRDKCKNDLIMVEGQIKGWEEYDKYSKYVEINERYNKIREEGDKWKGKIGMIKEYEEWMRKKNEYERYSREYNTIIKKESEVKLKELDKKLEDITKKNATNEMIKRLKELKKVIPSYNELNKLRDELNDMNKQLVIMLEAKGEREHILKDIKKNEDNQQKVNKMIKENEQMLNIFVNINDKLRSSHKDIYERYIIPKIENEVNRIVNSISVNEIKLGHEIVENQKETYKFGIKWMMHDKGVIVPIKKASGFQRFIIGIGMRIGLVRIGMSNINCGVLFIDEGFTSCDSEHMNYVNDFLNKIIDEGYYRRILLASHLDIIKDNVEKVIMVRNDGFIVR